MHFMDTWKIYISHDSCNDFTWGNDETSTRDNLAEIMRAHLDAMTQSDHAHPDERDHYTATTFVEALCFLEKYPNRKAELVARAKSRRLTLSPWLCNTLWGSMTPEGNLRAMTAARLLEIETGIPLDVGNHSEMPSLPLGVVPLLAGAGVNWVCVPWLLFDTVWAKLETPPVFGYLGADGSRLNFVFDHFASLRAQYVQGLKILNEPERIPEWLEHYAGLGERYPLRAVLAAGTHGDLYPEKRLEVEGLNASLCEINRREGAGARLVNASLGRFVDEVGNPNLAALPLERHSFGVAWEAWPVALAGIFARGRLAEHAYYDAETLLAFASLQSVPDLEYTRAARMRADDVIAMLGEHAWNGMNERSHRINQQLRRGWAAELQMLGETLEARAQNVLFTPDSGQFTLFNPLGHARRDVVRVPQSTDFSVSQDWQPFVQQDLLEDDAWTRVFVTPELEPFGRAAFHQSNPTPMPALAGTQAGNSSLENVHFSLALDPKRPGLCSLVHRASNSELRVGESNIAETVWYAGRQIPLEVTGCELLSHGPVLTRIAQHASAPGLHLTTTVTAYPDFEHLDFDVRIVKTEFHRHERLTQIFSVGRADAVPLVQTPGAVLRLSSTPDGDLHLGADRSRIAVSGFAQLEHPNGLCSVAVLEAFLLRPDLEPLSFECLGNDQNSPEVSHDQGGEREFRFRYRLRFDPNGTPVAAISQWAASFAHPLQVLSGRADFPKVVIAPDQARLVTQCLKPALDGRGLILRFWEMNGSSEPVRIALEGFAQVIACDLLERDQQVLKLEQNAVFVPVRGWGFGAIRLMPSA